MKSKLRLCLALVLSVILLGCSTVPSEKTAKEKPWQTTLRNSVTNSFFPPSGSLGIMFYTVPAGAAKSLESEPQAELVPFLARLRSSKSSWAPGTVDEWLIIVREGLHGTPSIITNTLTSKNGVVVSTTVIPVYTYADHFLQSNDNLTKRISNILTDCQKIKSGMTREELLKNFTTEGGLSTVSHQTFVYCACPYVKLDVDFTASDPKQKMVDEQPTDIIIKISRPYLDWSIID